MILMTSNLLALEQPPATSTSQIVPLQGATDAVRSGNKACNLARLAAAGIPVPSAIVITNDVLEALLEASGLRGPIAELSRDFASKGAPGVAGAADSIQALILASAVPLEMREEIERAAGTLGRGPWIVRSSACGEDGEGASFAGQLDSIGDVRSADAVIEAVVRVWASRWSHRALAYASARRTAIESMGVIVQRQVDARWSGVLFTEAPGRRDEMVMEFCRGMGEALVSGRANPGRVSIARRDLRWTLLMQPEAGPDPSPPLASLVDDRCLREIAHVALAIERTFGCPQDIEWAQDQEGRLWIVQSRPIARPAQPDAGEANAQEAERSARLTGRTRVVWSNANVNENFPDPISPLLYSIARLGYYHYFRNLGRSFGISRHRLDAMEQPLRHIIGVQGARMYYNLTSIHSVLRSAPAGNLLAASFDEFVGSESTPTAAAVPFAARARHTVTEAAEVVRIAVQTAWQYVRIESRLARFEQRADEFAARTHPDRLRSRTLGALLDDFRGFLHIRCLQWNDAALADAGSMVCYGVLQRLLARAFPEEDQQALHNSLLKALPGLVSSRPAIEIWRLSQQVRANSDLAQLFASADAAAILDAVRRDRRFVEFDRALSRFQEEWGFRCSGELMLTVPSFQEEAAPLIGLIRNYLTLGADSPVAVLERQAAERIADTERVRRQLGSRRVVRFVPRQLQRAAVMRVLRWTKACICRRERARLKQALLYSRLRRIALQMGERLAAGGRFERADDIFFLTAAEIDDLLSGSAMFPRDVAALIALRRRGHTALSTATPPDSMTLEDTEYFSVAATAVESESGIRDQGSRIRNPKANHPTTDCASDASQPAAAHLQGLGACGGTVMAPAAVLADVRESQNLRAGDVLVTRQTDPGWGPVFPLISGLVVERGGMLSHGAIIAREFGIPSVVGVRDATRRISHGSVVRVDGNRGTVEILGEAP